MNKIIKTKVGDEIHYFVNGQENHGVVAKMSATYVTIFKEDGRFYQVPIDETFFVKDILINKTWDDMSMEEKTEQLQKIKAYSPRYLSKSWEQLPKELQEVLQKATGALPKPEVKPTKTLPQAPSMQNRAAQAASTVPHPDDESAKDKYAIGGLEQEGGVRGKSPLKKSIDIEKDATTPHERTTSNRFYGRNQGSTPKVIDSESPNTEEYYGNEFPYSHSNATNPSKGHQSKEGQATQARRSLLNPTSLRGDKYYSEKPFSRGSQSSYTRSRTGDARDTSDDDHMRDQYGARRRTAEDERRDDEKELRAYRQGKTPEKKPEPKKLARGKSPLEKALDDLNKLKSDVEQGVYGNVAGRPTNGLSTDTKVDAPKDYEGQSHDGIRSDQFKYEDKKPKVDDDHKNKAGEFVYSEHTPYKTKSIGVPLSQQNTWGIKYVTKEEAEKLKKEE